MYVYFISNIRFARSQHFPTLLFLAASNKSFTFILIDRVKGIDFIVVLLHLHYFKAYIIYKCEEN